MMLLNCWNLDIKIIIRFTICKRLDAFCTFVSLVSRTIEKEILKQTCFSDVQRDLMILRNLNKG